MTTSADGDFDEPRVSILITDDGPGIEPERLAHIFDPFYTTRSGGTGLGLANVERIVRAHGGSIRVESEPGEGTSFLLMFPLSQPLQTGTPEEVNVAR